MAIVSDRCIEALYYYLNQMTTPDGTFLFQNIGVSQSFEIFFSKFAGAGRNRNCRNISRHLPVVSGAGRFEVSPRAGLGKFWPFGPFWQVLRAKFPCCSNILGAKAEN